MQSKDRSKAKGKRDKWANGLTFSLTLALSALVLIEGFRVPDVSQAIL